MPQRLRFTGPLCWRRPPADAVHLAKSAIRRIHVVDGPLSPYSSIIAASQPAKHERITSQERVMNIAKHMETIFLATIMLVGATGIATAAVAKFQRVAPEPKVFAVAVEGAPMAVVKVSAKRLTAAQKAML
jgi:hypothetical protein